nr:hypothetical protein [Candidatus Sigynarchaeota archaeon]
MAATRDDANDHRITVTMGEKIVLAFLFFLSWVLIVPIPFTLFIFQDDKTSTHLKNARHILYLSCIALFSISGTILAYWLFLSMYPVEIDRIGPVPTLLWD